MDCQRIAIAGCGPAGLAAALLLDRQSHSVEIFESFEKPRPVGSGLMLQPTGLAVLDKLGLARAVFARGAAIERLYGLNESGKVVLDARYGELNGPQTQGLGIHRASLFDILHAAANDAGIVIHTGSHIVGSLVTRSGRTLELQSGEKSEPFDLVVDATGLHTPLGESAEQFLPFGALWATVRWPGDAQFNDAILEQRYRRAHEMAGLLPIGSRSSGGVKEAAFFWSLKRHEAAAWRARPLDEWKDEVFALWPQLSPVLGQLKSHDDLTFARYAHRTVRRPVADRLIRIGDAWHSASPQLGQGANMALLDAWALARGFEEGRTVDEAMRLTMRWRSEHVRLYQWITAIFTPLYQSDANIHAVLRDRLVAPLSRIWPVKILQAQLMSGLFGAPLAQLGLDRLDYTMFQSASSTSARASSPVHS